MASFALPALLVGCLAIAFAISLLWGRSRVLAIALALAVPLAAAGWYWTKGRPAEAKPPGTLAEAVAQLEGLTKADPKNFSDMAALARAHMAAGDYAKARDAYQRALALQPGQSALYVEYAESLLRTSPDRRFPPEAVALLERALAAEPGDQRALFFLGLHQRQSGQPAAAVQTWEKLLAQLDVASSAELRKQVDAARADAGMPAMAEAPVLKVTVALDPMLARDLSPGAVLFVFARSFDGSGPPLAAKRLQPQQFPVALELGDADSPMPAAKLFSQDKVILMARLSKSGQLQPMAGDLEADPLALDVTPGGEAELVLNRSLQ